MKSKDVNSNIEFLLGQIEEKDKEIQELIKKWEERISLHRSVCEDPLMYTKEDRIKNSHYAQALCGIMADLKQIPK